MQWLYVIYTAEDCLARLLGTFWTKLRVRLSFSPSSILFSDDRQAMARTPSCIRAISALPYPLPLATYATARPKGTRHPRPPVFFPSRLLSGKTCDSPLQIINISFQRIPHLMLTVGISGSFDIFFTFISSCCSVAIPTGSTILHIARFHLNLYVRLGRLFHMPRWEHFQENMFFACVAVSEMALYQYQDAQGLKTVSFHCDGTQRHSPPSLPNISSYIGGLPSLEIGHCCQQSTWIGCSVPRT